MFKPIRTAEDLPANRVSHETFQLELKLTESRDHAEERAKDVAAFANAIGGVILVGAKETRPDRRLEYVPMTEESAVKIANAYGNAVRDRCLPQPVTEIHRIRHGDTGDSIVVAVNVWPFPGQPIGVAIGDRTAHGSAKAFAFPYRTGVDTSFYTPDQLPMFMTPQSRQVAILLAAIPIDKRRDLILTTAWTNHNHRWGVSMESTYEDVVMGNTIRFKHRGSDKCFAIPADSVVHVWRGVDGNWQICTTMRMLEDHVTLVPDPTK